jgi:hypothetical protein
MTRKQRRLDRIRAIAREFEVALAVAKELDERFRVDPSVLSGERLTFKDYRNFRDNLEPTYIIRMFAEFESGLREAWELAFRRSTNPKTVDLIDSIAAHRLIPQDWRDHAHEVREYRNAIVHEGGDPASVLTVQEVRGHLGRFFSHLPHDW